MSFDPASEGWRRQGAVPPDDGFMNLVGPLWLSGSGADMSVGLLVERRHLNPAGFAHGGMLATFADHALGSLVLEASGVPAVTIQLDIQYLSAARPGDFIVARSEMVRQTRSLCFVRLVAFVGDRAVLAADGIWKLRTSSGLRSE